VAADSSATETLQSCKATERAVAALWKEVLALPEFPGAEDNFFALGGDSTAMVMVELRIQEEFSVELTPGAMLNAPSLGELVRLIEERQGSTS
jgi:acyl carrier protein